MRVIVILFKLLSTGLPIDQILRFWKEIVMILLISVILYQNFVETRFLFFLDTIPSYQKRLNDVNHKLKLCKDNNDTLQNDINSRNNEIEQWKQATTVLEQQTEQLKQDVIATQTQTKHNVIQILKDPTPQGSQEAIKYLRDGIKDLTWEK